MISSTACCGFRVMVPQKKRRGPGGKFTRRAPPFVFLEGVMKLPQENDTLPRFRSCFATPLYGVLRGFPMGMPKTPQGGSRAKQSGIYGGF